MSEDKEKKYSSMKEQFQSGSICTCYGSTYLVSVVPIPGIDKCRFAIVKIGTSGKDALNFYLDMEEMRQLCEEFLGDAATAKRKIKADMEKQYPEAYSYVTGENGSMTLAIGAGKKGCLVQIRDKSKKESRLTVVAFKDLKEMAFNFNLVMGLIPVMKSSYYGQLYQAFWNGVAERDSRHKAGY